MLPLWKYWIAGEDNHSKTTTLGKLDPSPPGVLKLIHIWLIGVFLLERAGGGSFDMGRARSNLVFRCF